jgi:hypothetical protein
MKITLAGLDFIARSGVGQSIASATPGGFCTSIVRRR